MIGDLVFRGGVRAGGMGEKASSLAAWGFLNPEVRIDGEADTAHGAKEERVPARVHARSLPAGIRPRLTRWLGGTATGCESRRRNASLRSIPHQRRHHPDRSLGAWGAADGKVQPRPGLGVGALGQLPVRIHARSSSPSCPMARSGRCLWARQGGWRERRPGALTGRARGINRGDHDRCSMLSAEWVGKNGVLCYRARTTKASWANRNCCSAIRFGHFRPAPEQVGPAGVGPLRANRVETLRDLARSVSPDFIFVSPCAVSFP
jgi:hypothetical protein